VTGWSRRGNKAHGRIGRGVVGNGRPRHGLVGGAKPCRRLLWTGPAKRRGWKRSRREVGALPTTADRFGGRSDLRWTRFGGFTHRVIARVSRSVFGPGTTHPSGRGGVGRPRPLRRHRERDGTVAEQACLPCSSDVEGLFGGPEHHSSGGPGRRIWEQGTTRCVVGFGRGRPGAACRFGQQHTAASVVGRVRDALRRVSSGGVSQLGTSVCGDEATRWFPPLARRSTSVGQRAGRLTASASAPDGPRQRGGGQLAARSAMLATGGRAFGCGRGSRANTQVCEG